MKRIYMDHAATTPVDPEVVAAMLPFFTENYGNASSMHAFGQEARQAIEQARESIALLIGAKPDEIIFTSGGTESDNFAVKGIAYARKDKGNHIITSAVEHHAVLEPCHFLEKNGFQVTVLPVDETGLVDPVDVKKAITDKTTLISIMHANNEIGTIEPVREIGAIARECGIAFHTDAVQTFGRIPVNVADLNVDLLSASGHKLYGPKGVGILYIRKGTRIVPFMHGGEQEKNRRASTYNVPGIVGMGKAAELAGEHMEREAARLTSLRDRMIRGILDGIDHSRLNGHPVLRLPNNVNVSLEYVEGESMLLSLDMEGIACSTGSACSSQSLEPSHVLRAIGLPHEIAHGSLRFSMGRVTSDDDVDTVLTVLPRIVDRLRAMSPLYGKKH
ncbi:MAG: cysteine desulfurase NifS [Deltaproteobacteria bacterium HGW-Deltaproteobacteria-19]|jgi:cysteine desulfurase|nr:MAG: cysteine desulfurase NifS [Deltaproteobacteria bacterium HGW-Deltaproteobacteria-19]